MAALEVTSVTVPDVLEKLRRREWLIPEFQRDFVWSISDVIDLVASILDARPIGMATLWAQPDTGQLSLEPISVPDDTEELEQKLRYFSVTAENPKKIWAILDGKQRCTAIALAFGGLKAQNPIFRFAGRFFLDVTADDATQQVVFKRDKEIKKAGLTSDAACIAKGLFPLAPLEGQDLAEQWMGYLSFIHNPKYYEGNVLPAEEELDRRDRVLKKAFKGLTGTKLAVYIVPDNYSLGEICDIFEKLNTTGARVSTVDLIHSWLYSDTEKLLPKPVLLRNWLDELGSLDGAVGWSSSSDRPELIAQFVTACYIALDRKVPARPFKGNTSSSPSIKSGDLLATPTAHWLDVMGETDRFASYLLDFQTTVAEGPFSYDRCPYPASAGIYIALRWYSDKDAPDDKAWGRNDIDALYRAFFWRNALRGRYDQGFLTKLGIDLRDLKAILASRKRFPSSSTWVDHASKDLNKIVEAPSREDVVGSLLAGNRVGATAKALTLLMIAKTQKDLIDPGTSLRHPSLESVELHHIFPRAWCENNKTGALSEILQAKEDGKNYVSSVANLMPLSRKSNNLWKQKAPGQMLQERGISYETNQLNFGSVFIDETGFNLLLQGAAGIPDFWNHRAAQIADALMRRMEIVL
jgi:hypothetical protein